MSDPRNHGKTKRGRDEDSSEDETPSQNTHSLDELRQHLDESSESEDDINPAREIHEQTQKRAKQTHITESPRPSRSTPFAFDPPPQDTQDNAAPTPVNQVPVSPQIQRPTVSRPTNSPTITQRPSSAFSPTNSPSIQRPGAFRPTNSPIITQRPTAPRPSDSPVNTQQRNSANPDNNPDSNPTTPSNEQKGGMKK